MTSLNFQAILPSLPYILQGLKVTLFYTGFSLLGGLVLGTVLTLLKLSRISLLRFLASAYTSVFRGTPLLLQLSLIYYSSQGMTGYNIAVWQAGIFAFSLNSAAYISEIMRAGIQSIDRGQFDAAIALGIPYALIMRDIIIPQALRNILPALVNEVIDLLKESSLVSTITEADLMRRATIVAAEHHLYFEPLLVVGVIYYLLVLFLGTIAHFFEKRLRVS